MKKAGAAEDPIEKVLAVCASPRKGGNTDVIVKQMLSGLKAEKIDTVGVHLRDMDLNGCTGCEKCRKDKICTELYDGMTLL